MPLLTLISFIIVLPASADDVRRALHEPLFPIEWTPPPTTTAPPGPGFAADPSTPVPPDNGGPALLPPPPPPNTVAADASSSGTGPAPRLHGGGGGTPKAAIVVASAAAAAVLALLAFAAAFFLTGRLARHHAQQHKPPAVAGAAHSGAATMAARSDAMGSSVAGSSSGAPYRKVLTERARRGMCRDIDTVPSPELRPLPPLRRGESSDDDAAYYTPGQRSAESGGGEGGGTWSEASASSPRTTTPSRRSLPSLTSDFFPPTPAATAAAVAPPPPAPPAPRSRRTLPRTRFSAGSASDMIKQMVSPPTNQSAPPPPPPPPPPPAARSNNAIPKPPPPPPEPSTGPSWARRLLKPAQTEGPSSAMTRAPVASLMKDNDNSTGMSVRTQNDAARDEGRPKLKPLHWDKVRACSDRDMVWDRLKSNSFQLDEDTIEVLFTNNTANAPSTRETPKKAGVPQCRQEKVLDPKKAQNIAILLRALNVTLEVVSDALLNGNAEALGAELLETLVKMAPTKEEELKLRNFPGDISKLGSAERFLKAVLDIPFSFRRVDAMLYRANFESEIHYLRKSFETLEAACDDLKGSRLFLKLLEAVLRTGNRMNVGTNRGQAKAFKLDSLLKLADVKGTDGKTTLLHFVVQEIVRSEDAKSEKAAENQTRNIVKDEQFRKQGLNVVSGLSNELGNVKKAASTDFEMLHGYVSKLEGGLGRIKSVLQLEKQCTQGQKFFTTMHDFLQEATLGIEQVRCEEKRALGRVKEITEYFHGDAAKEEAHPLRIFTVVRDFLSMLDHVCREVSQQDRTVLGSARSFRMSTASNPVLNTRIQHGTESTSDEESSSL